MNKRILFLGLFLFLSLSVVAAEDFGYNYLEGDLDIARAVNYSEVNVNNSQFLRGYTPTTLRDWFNTLYCKLTGCEMSGDIDMNNNSITNILSTTYDINGCDGETHEAGYMCYDYDADTLSLTTRSGQVIQLSREVSERGINRNSDLSDGSVVYLSGTSGDNPEFKSADSRNASRSLMVGVLTTDCLANELCPVVWFGYVNNLDTTSWEETDHLYIDPNNPGQLTNVVPMLPNNTIWVATVIRKHATQGRIFVNPKIDPSDGFLIENIWASGNVTIEGNLNVNKIFANDWSNISIYDLGDVEDSANDLEFLQYNATSGNWHPIKIETTYYNATSSDLLYGTLDGGTLNDTKHSDGNYDGITLNISEDNTAPGLDIRINFTNIDRFDRGIVRYKTSTLSGEKPKFQIWDYIDEDWEDYESATQSLTFRTPEVSVFDDSSHIQNGTVQVRLYKAENGNINNHYYFDWLAISKGFGTPAGQEIDPISIHKDGSVPLTDNWDTGNFNITAESFFSNFIGNLTNKITKIFTQDIEVSGKINLTNSTYNNQIYTNENGTLIIKSQNGETRFY